MSTEHTKVSLSSTHCPIHDHRSNQCSPRTFPESSSLVGKEKGPSGRMSDIRCRKCHWKKPTRHTHTEQSYERTRPFPSWQSDVPPPPPPPSPLHQPVAPSVISTVPPTAPPPAPYYPPLPTLAQAQSIVNTIYHIRQISADVRQPKYEKALDTLRSLQFLCQNIMTKHNL